VGDGRISSFRIGQSAVQGRAENRRTLTEPTQDAGRFYGSPHIVAGHVPLRRPTGDLSMEPNDPIDLDTNLSVPADFLEVGRVRVTWRILPADVVDAQRTLRRVGLNALVTTTAINRDAVANEDVRRDIDPCTVYQQLDRDIKRIDRE